MPLSTCRVLERRQTCSIMSFFYVGYNRILILFPKFGMECDDNEGEKLKSNEDSKNVDWRLVNHVR